MEPSETGMPADSETYFNVPGVATVVWDSNGDLVLVEWQGWADSAEFSALLDAEVKALRDHGGSRLLADCRRQRVLNPGDQDKADREWLPKAIAAGLKRFAIVLPTSALAALNLQDRLGKVPSSVMEIAYFDELGAAREWLRIQSVTSI
jgi:hypothetical protein